MKYTSYPAYEDGTDRVFRNVGIQQSDAGEIPKTIHTSLLEMFKRKRPSPSKVPSTLTFELRTSRIHAKSSAFDTSLLVVALHYEFLLRGFRPRLLKLSLLAICTAVSFFMLRLLVKVRALI